MIDSDFQELAKAVDELVVMAKSNSSCGEDRDVFLCDKELPRVIGIGTSIHMFCGMQGMQAVHAEVRRRCGSIDAKHLEYAWDGIGEWLA